MVDNTSDATGVEETAEWRDHCSPHGSRILCLWEWEGLERSNGSSEIFHRNYFQAFTCHSGGLLWAELIPGAPLSSQKSRSDSGSLEGSHSLWPKPCPLLPLLSGLEPTNSAVICGFPVPLCWNTASELTLTPVDLFKTPGPGLSDHGDLHPIIYLSCVHV